MINPKDFSKIGLGTWGLGGYAQYDPSIDIDHQIQMIAYTIDAGVNFSEVQLWGAQGKSAKIICSGLKNSTKEREEFFLSQVVYGHDLKSFTDINTEIKKLRELSGSDTTDSLSIEGKFCHKIGVDNCIDYLQEKLNQNEIRYVGITNYNLKMSKRFQKEFGDKLVLSELGYNFEVRDLEDMGILKFNKENDIKSIVFQPLRRNRTAKRKWDLLISLAEKYNKTVNQIILNWLTKKGLYPIIKSTTKRHIDENLAALDFELSDNDFKSIEEFRVPDYTSPEIDWENTGNGVAVDQLSNVFEDRYDK
jgi:diketogulonate reductase-like aldo/keto reductase